MSRKRCVIFAEHERMGKNIERCIMCEVKIGKSITERWDEETALISIETKQRFLNLVRGGKSIGEARTETEIQPHLAIHILHKQIESTSFINWKIAA